MTKPGLRLLFNLDSTTGLSASNETIVPAEATASAPPANAAPETAPETMGAKKTDDDANRKASAPKTGLGARIRKRISKTVAAFSKAGFAKGRGRPKKCRSCGGEKCADCNFTGLEPGKGDVAAGAAVDTGHDHTGEGHEAGTADSAHEAAPGKFETESVASAGAAVDQTGAEIFSEACAYGLETIVDIGEAVVQVLSERRGHTADFVRGVLDRCRPKQEKFDRSTKAVKLALKESGYVPEKPGLVSAIISVAGLMSGYVVAFFILRKAPTPKKS